MANPNLQTLSSLTHDILIEAQLSSGDNNYTVPSGKSWIIKSFSLVNVSGSSVNVYISVVKAGGTARRVVPVQALAVTGTAGDGLVVDPDTLAVLPEGAVIRVNASAGTAVDIVVTGVVAAS